MTTSSSPIELQLRGYSITTAEILYFRPDHPSLLQSFTWQKLDLAPQYPQLKKFLEFWEDELEGKLHAVEVTRNPLIAAPSCVYANGMWMLH